MKDPQDTSKSLNKYISETGICSRREADKMIEAGRVKINGQKAQKGNRVEAGDKVTLDGKKLQVNTKNVYIAFNKPTGIVCTTDLREKKNIISYIGHKERLFPIGRLDKPSQGLIFLTNDGDIVNKILRAGNQHEKEYVVRVDKAINRDFIKRMAGGLPILGTKTKKCFVEQISKYEFRIILTQGMNRQIRRMCEFLKYNVVSLERIRIMDVTLGHLEIGKWRHLTAKEMKQIMRAVASSSKTEEASRKKT